MPADHGKHIGLYEAEGYIGSQVYIVNDDDREIYYWGTLLESYEKNMNKGEALEYFQIQKECRKFKLPDVIITPWQMHLMLARLMNSPVMNGLCS